MKKKSLLEIYLDGKNSAWFFLGEIAIIGIVVFLISHFLIQISFVVGSSMEPTLSSNDLIFVQKFNLEKSIDYNSIILARPDIDGHRETIIKRVIGKPGDTVLIKDGAVYVNGNPFNEKIGNPHIENAGTAENLIILDNKHYFVLGDNRNESTDSRYPSVGPIHVDDIQGVVLFQKN